MLIARDLGMSARDLIATPVSGIVSPTSSDQAIASEPKKDR